MSADEQLRRFTLERFNKTGLKHRLTHVRNAILKQIEDQPELRKELNKALSVRTHPDAVTGFINPTQLQQMCNDAAAGLLSRENCLAIGAGISLIRNNECCFISDDVSLGHSVFGEDNPTTESKFLPSDWHAVSYPELKINQGSFQQIWEVIKFSTENRRVLNSPQELIDYLNGELNDPPQEAGDTQAAISQPE